MSHPRVSVIIPSYQCDRYVKQAIESVLIQTDCTFEILLIDDGSTDSTQAVVSTLINRQAYISHDLIQYIYQQNQGVCAARNHGTQVARGEFLVFLDADDYFLPEKLKKQVTVFDANPDLGLVHTGWQTVDESGITLQNICPWEAVPQLDLESWIRFKPVLPSAMMIRRSWIERVGGFDPTYQVAEDIELVLRLTLAGCASSWLQEITVAYRQHSNSAMKDGTAQHRDVQRVIDQLFSLPNLPASIQLIEPEVRYSTLVWIACYLYRTGNIDLMVQTFQQTLCHSPFTPIETVLNWVESLKEFAKQQNIKLDICQLTSSVAWQDLIQSVVSSSIIPELGGII